MTDHFDAIPGVFARSAGMPMPDWQVVSQWAESTHDNSPEVWHQLASDWIARIARWRPAGLELVAQDEWILLSALAPKRARATARFLQSCLDRLRKTFPELVIREYYGPFVAIVFRDHSEYYDYVDWFYTDDGEWGASAGIYLNQGYGHMATFEAVDWHMREVLAHETVHAVLAHRPLPLWLEEGLTQVATDRLVGSDSLHLTRETIQRQREYWSSHGMNTFWSGDAFGAADEGMAHAYTLAYVIFRRELEDRREQLLRFLEDVAIEDHGEAAAQRHFGCSLAALVAPVLGSDVAERE